MQTVFALGKELETLSSIRQSFLNGALTRLVDPDRVLRGKIVEFVQSGDFGLASGARPEGTYERVWFKELVAPDEVAFEAGVFLLKKDKAAALKSGLITAPGPQALPLAPEAVQIPQPVTPTPTPGPSVDTRTFHLVGAIPPEVWNRLGTKLLPKLRSGSNLQVGIDFSVSVKADLAGSLAAEIRQILDDLGLADKIQIKPE